MTLMLATGIAAVVPRSAFLVPVDTVAAGNEERGTGNHPLHDLHLTHTRMVIEGGTIACRIRLFKDDLEKALRLFAAKPDLTLTAEARSDSLFGAYFEKTVTLEADGKRLRLKVSASGTERDPSSQDIVWYVLEGETASTVSRLGLLNGLMFELFRDQQNLVQLLGEPGGIRKTLYFVGTDPREQVVSF